MLTDEQINKEDLIRRILIDWVIVKKTDLTKGYSLTQTDNTY